MKKLIFTLAVICFALIAAQGEAADEAAQARDRAAVLQLSGFEARRTMLEVCGVTGDEADKLLANDIAATDALEASLSAEGKKSLRIERAHAREAVLASWKVTPDEQREKSCDQLKQMMAR